MKLSVTDVLPLAQAIYDRSCVGCCAHIVLDDGNVRDSDVKFCLEQAMRKGHEDCLELCKALTVLSKTQRLKLGDMVER